MSRDLLVCSVCAVDYDDAPDWNDWFSNDDGDFCSNECFMAYRAWFKRAVITQQMLDEAHQDVDLAEGMAYVWQSLGMA